MSESPHSPSTDSEDGYTVAPDGARIAWRRWSPKDPPRGLVVVLHGVGEHGARYAEVAAQFNGAGYVVTAMDFRGHGRTPGRRGAMRMEPTLGDIDRLIEQEVGRLGDRPVFLYGHSLGGLVAFLYGLDREPDLAGVVVTGPAFYSQLRDEQPMKVAAARYLSRVLPNFTIPSGLPIDRLNRDPAVLAAYEADPLVHDRASAGFGADSFAAMDRVVREADRFRLPLLIVHGGADVINPLKGSQAVADRVPGCTLSVYDGVYHAVEHEPERPQIIADVIHWMDAHTST
jgi:acylglycerol lipase